MLERAVLGFGRVLAPRQDGRPEGIRTPQVHRVVLEHAQPAAERLLAVDDLDHFASSLIGMRQPLLRLLASRRNSMMPLIIISAFIPMLTSCHLKALSRLLMPLRLSMGWLIACALRRDDGEVLRRIGHCCIIR